MDQLSGVKSYGIVWFLSQLKKWSQGLTVKRERLTEWEMIKHEAIRLRRAYNLGNGGLKTVASK